MSMRPADRPRAVPLLAAAGVAAAAAAAGFGAHGLWGGGARPVVTTAVPVAAAPVVRTDLSSRQQVPGTLGYQGFYTVASELDGGILTWLPSPGATARRGQPLFAISGQPAVLLYGALPAWRAFGPGMTPGPDVQQLQRNLTALGFGTGPADGQFGWSTQVAVDHWQQARGMTVTGTIPLGTVVFLPGPLRVTALAQPLGAAVQAGASVLSGTSLTPGVQVWLPVGGTPVRRGDQVLVTMPDGATTVPGTVTAVGSVAGPSGGQGGGSSSGGGSASDTGGGSGSGATVPVTITISGGLPVGLDQAPVQVAITEQRADNVLAVPVTALLATPGGGYAVEAAGPHGRLIPVTTGLFDDASGMVAVTGAGLTPGLSVEVAQG
ncbi:MAG TPA: peptidoglycan-binding domain-containing protein [Trebonia sp.]|nr:peptidoglycan-binding domain-containing protein [Trebonia sp.]